jgi:GTP-binding protein
VRWLDTKINIVDTPGHADFGGEVERILRMVDGFLLLVDAAEGPMPQTRFVAGKALALGLKPLVLVNNNDRRDAKPPRAHHQVRQLSSTGTTSTPAPCGLPPGPLQMRVSTCDYSSYVGRIGIGRVERGRIRVGETVALLPLGDPGPVFEGLYEQAKVAKLFAFEGVDRVEVEVAEAGEIVALAGLDGVEVGKTITALDTPERLAGIAVEEPTISVDMLVNNSPFAGREGKFVTGRQLRERLYRELERNVALRVEDTDNPYTFTVSGRGELHLGILMETMRREGYEFQVSRPRVIPREGPDGEQLEPYEELMIDGPEGYLGEVIQKLGPRRKNMLEVKNHRMETVRCVKVPAQELLGPPFGVRRTRGNGIGIIGSLSMAGRADHWPGQGPGGGPGGGGGRICALQSAGAGHPVHQTRGSGVRGDDRGGERPHRGHGCERGEGEEALEHANHRIRRDDHARAAAAGHAGTSARVH